MSSTPSNTLEKATVRRTGIVIDPRCGNHCMEADAPECPARLDVLQAMLREPAMGRHFVEIPARPVGRRSLEEVHAPAYIDRLEATAAQPRVYFDEDTSTSPGSHEAALLAAGGLCRAIAKVHTGALDNAFALVRPPGHHAERAQAKGFCLYNNVAVGARFAQHELGLRRILIVDWDLHHGNGTQNCFADDPSVLFFSTHRAFAYPYTGRLRDVGKGRGKGYTVNIPLLPGFGNGEYLALFQMILSPIALSFKPDLVLVSAGFDIHVDDPMGGMRVTPEGFAGLTRLVMNIADACCRGKLVMSLEGGYDLEGLRDSVRRVLREMAGLQTADTAALMASADPRRLAYPLWRVQRIHGRYWPPLADLGVRLSLMDRFRSLLTWWGAYLGS
jgi:acetoin utilization deacetylase AcuC-like enzyme